MPLLFREFVFCECGRPAMHRSESCRTCYEDGLRRKWREELSLFQNTAAPVPLKRVGVRELRKMRVWPREEDAERSSELVASKQMRR
jgi:hypothetical protein